MRIFDTIHPIMGVGNSYLILRESECVLIDSGYSRGAKKIIDAVKSFASDKPLATIIVTHAHLDHIRGLETLSILFGAEVIVHKDEGNFIMKLEKFPRAQGFLSNIVTKLTWLMSPPPYPIDRIVTNGEVIHGLKIIHVPGHTPGSIALLDSVTGVLFTGDAITTNKKGSKILPPHRAFCIDIKEARKSALQLVKDTQPSAILPGHGKPILDPEKHMLAYKTKFGG